MDEMGAQRACCLLLESCASASTLEKCQLKIVCTLTEKSLVGSDDHFSHGQLDEGSYHS